MSEMKSQERDEFWKRTMPNAAKTQNEHRKLYIEFGSMRPCGVVSLQRWWVGAGCRDQGAHGQCRLFIKWVAATGSSKALVRGEDAGSEEEGGCCLVNGKGSSAHRKLTGEEFKDRMDWVGGPSSSRPQSHLNGVKKCRGIEARLNLTSQFK